MSNNPTTLPVNSKAAVSFEAVKTSKVPTEGISLINLTKKYGELTVVKDVNLAIEPGEFMTFLGPSGSGKSTTLSMIAGFTDISSGELKIHGDSVQNLPAHKRGIGMVFQNYALFPHMSVRANVEFPLKMRKIAKSERDSMIQDALAMVHMEEYANRSPAELSGGQQQRIALARALVYRPSVLLMDEPLGALDKKLRDWLQSEIKRVHAEVGATFVYVTHDQEEALSMSDRIAVFNNGKIEQVGTGVELYENPQTLFVGTFLGESTVFYGTNAGTTSIGTVLNFAGKHLHTVTGLEDKKLALLLRPEKLTLCAAGSIAASAVNQVAVTVTSATYLGAVWRYVVELPDGSSALVRTESNTGIPEVGQPALLQWNVESGVLLRDDR